MFESQPDAKTNRPSSCASIFLFAMGGGVLFFIMAMLTLATVGKFNPSLFEQFHSAGLETAGAAIPFVFFGAAVFGMLINIGLGHLTAIAQSKTLWFAGSLFLMLIYPVLCTYWVIINISAKH